MQVLNRLSVVAAGIPFKSATFVDPAGLVACVRSNQNLCVRAQQLLPVAAAADGAWIRRLFELNKQIGRVVSEHGIVI